MADCAVSQERIQQERARAKSWYENAPSLANRKEFREGYQPNFANSSERVPDTIDSFVPDEDTLRLCMAVVWGECAEDESAEAKSLSE